MKQKLGMMNSGSIKVCIVYVQVNKRINVMVVLMTTFRRLDPQCLDLISR